MRSATKFLFISLLATSANATQFGLPFPSHRFPTDTSFHASFALGLGSTSENYSTTGTATPLTGSQSVGWIKNSIQLEYQPSNHFSFGGNFTFLRTTLDAGATSLSNSRWSLGDQTIFAEYRFIDGPGYSLGMSGLIKFPGYLNESITEAQEKGFALLPGDAQTDFGGMLSAEVWPTTTFRVQGDFGYLFRTQGFADHLIYQGSVAFVIPRVDLSFRLMGFHSIGNGPTPGTTFENEITTVQRDYFAGSAYAYASTPSLLMMSPKVEFWIGPEYAATATYTRTIMGTDAAKGSFLEFGFTYRFSERKQNARRSFTEVGIETDQSSGVFEGELQEKSGTAPTPPKAKPRQDFDFEPLYYESAE